MKYAHVIIPERSTCLSDNEKLAGAVIVVKVEKNGSSTDCKQYSIDLNSTLPTVNSTVPIVYSTVPIENSKVPTVNSTELTVNSTVPTLNST
jgi:hypothetical protein